MEVTQKGDEKYGKVERANSMVIFQVEEERWLVSNGCLDVRGRIADKRRTGGWKASPFIIVNEVAERLAFYAIAVNMAPYLILEMHESLPDSATHVTDWIGAAYVLTLLGAFFADAYLGRFKTIISFSSNWRSESANPIFFFFD